MGSKSLVLKVEQHLPLRTYLKILEKLKVTFLLQGRFRMDFRKHFFTEGIVKCWNRLPREAVKCPRLVSV